MLQFENKEIFGSLLRTTINVIGRRTSEAYLLKIEELGVNLHMIELKRNLLW